MTITRTTITTYEYSRETRELNIPFDYLRRDFIVVMLSGKEKPRKVLTLGVDYRFANKTTILVLREYQSSEGYTKITIQRVTGATKRIINFQDGSILNASELNVSQLQSLHVAEEARDLSSYTLFLDNDGNLDARGRKIINLGDPTEETADAVNVKFIEGTKDTILGARDLTLRYRDEAEGFRNEAEGFKTQTEGFKAESLNLKNTIEGKIAVVDASIISANNLNNEAVKNSEKALQASVASQRYANESASSKDKAKSSEVAAKLSEDKAREYAAQVDPDNIVHINELASSLGTSNRTTLTQKFISDNFMSKEIINVKALGAKGDGVSDDTLYFQQAVSTGKPLYIPKGTYVLTAGLTLTNSILGEGSDKVKLLFKGENIDSLIEKTSKGDIRGFTVEGSNVSKALFGLKCLLNYEPDREYIEDVNVLNIKHPENTCVGMGVYRTSDRREVKGNIVITNCTIENIRGNSIAKGIHFSLNNTLSSETSIIITRNIIRNITPNTDADAIHVNNEYREGPYNYLALIKDNLISSSVPMKRGIKVQYRDCKVLNNTVIGDNILIGYDTYSPVCSFSGNSFINSTTNGEAYNIHYVTDTVIENTTIKLLASVAPAIRVDRGSCLLSNVSIERGGGLGADTSALLLIENKGIARCSNINLKSNNTGCAVRLTDGELYMDSSSITNCKFGVRVDYGTKPIVHLSNSIIKDTNVGFNVLGTSDGYAKIDSVNINTTGTAIACHGGGIHLNTYIFNSTIKGLNGCVIGNGGLVSNSSFEASSSKQGSGATITSNSEVINSKFINYSAGISMLYGSVDLTVMGNRAIGCTTSYSKSNSMFIADVNNFEKS